MEEMYGAPSRCHDHCLSVSALSQGNGTYMIRSSQDGNRRVSPFRPATPLTDKAGSLPTAKAFYLRRHKPGTFSP